MSPRSLEATEPVASAASIAAELARVQARARELDDKSLALAQEFGAAQRRVGVLLADEADDDTTAAARRTVGELRGATDELVTARAVVAGRQKALRRELAPAEEREATAAAVAALAAADAEVRRAARVLAPLMASVERAVNAQAIAERQARTVTGSDRSDLHLMRDAGAGYVADLRNVAAAMARYTTEREAAT